MSNTFLIILVGILLSLAVRPVAKAIKVKRRKKALRELVRLSEELGLYNSEHENADKEE